MTYSGYRELCMSKFAKMARLPRELTPKSTTFQQTAISHSLRMRALTTEQVNANLFPVSGDPRIVHTIKRVPESLEYTDNKRNMVNVPQL